MSLKQTVLNLVTSICTKEIPPTLTLLPPTGKRG